MFFKKNPQPQPSRECACCTDDIAPGGGYHKNGKVFCDHGCAYAYAEHGNRPVSEWPPAPE